MSRRFPPWILAALVLLLFVIQAIATYWHLFFFIWWLDIPMHILGGIWVALFALASYYASSRIKEKDRSAIFVLAVAIACTLTIGLFWEFYEFGVDHAVGDSGVGLLDTLQDLANDLVGAILAALLFMHFGYNRNA